MKLSIYFWCIISKYTEMKTLKISSIFIWLGILLASLLTSCTSDINRSKLGYVDESYEFDDFKKIKLEGGYNVKLIQGDSCQVTVTASEDLQKNIKVTVEDELLRIKTQTKNIGTEEVKITITFKNIDDIKIEGGVLLTTPQVIKLNNLALNVEGGASIEMQMFADTFRAKAAGGVNMEFSGKVNEFTAISEGAANIDADHLESQDVICRVSGIGNASVFALKNLNASVDGVGKIGYRGDPEIVKKVNGIGAVYKR